ncbi:L-type lectin-domain containing protein [Enterococcus rivorum]|uniref:MucBP domain-containing protein n=1 Tax=Enterococcus rivorum TaxID=762845 RepID=A0A1E5KV14_9ENTE|nr:L-type lectin-domain containing protein [Enterococcus rivorum]MBP2100412.1 hypothetical protein [Enterococcus rivorum]OEH81714.1 hypothetical protein BCR26_15760 [Enterococcus rivorum]
MSKKKKYVILSLLTITFVGSVYLKEASQYNNIQASNGENQSSVVSTAIQGRASDPKVVPLENIFSVPTGANSKTIDNKYVLITDNLRNQVGSIFSNENNKFDLTKDATSEMYIKINGTADGVTFVLHNDANRIKKYTGVNGAGLGVYAGSLDGSSLVGQIEKSFAIEFDTYHNGDRNDGDVSSNSSKGHVAYSFPDDKSTYTFSGNYVKKQVHLGLQYPNFRLGDNVWRKFTVDWKALNENGVGQLTYQLEGLDPVTVSIPRTTFSADSVYWGFTGSTGALTESALVGFASVPGLVNYKDSLKLYSSAGDLLGNESVEKGDSEITVHYSGEFISGKQNLLDPSITFTKNAKQTYIEGSMTVNGALVNPTVTSTAIKTSFANLSLENKKVDIIFKVKNNGLNSNDRPEIVSRIDASNFTQNDGNKVSYVIDNQPPKGIGKLTVVNQYDTEKISGATDYNYFLRALSDDFTPNDKITIALKSGQDIETLVQQLGPSYFELSLTDKVGNTRDIKVPIFVKSSEEQIKNNDHFLLKGRNFTFIDYNYPKTENELRNFILEQSYFELWQFNDDGTSKKLDGKLSIVDISKLPKVGTLPLVKEYSVPIKYTSGSSTVELVIKFNVEAGFSSVTITFLNEENQPLRDSIILTGKIGTSIDLTKEVAIQNRIKELKENHYEQVKAPSNETAILVEKNAKEEAYQFKGTLFVKSFPTKINFGDKYLAPKFIKAEQPTYDVPLIVGDNRTNKTPWKLTATLEKALTSVEDPNEVMSRALWYKKSDAEKVMLSQGEAQEIEVGTISASGEYNVSNNWNKNKTGLQLNLFSNEVIQTGKYRATILWQVGKTP